MQEAQKPRFFERVLPSGATFLLPFLFGLALCAVFLPITGATSIGIGALGAAVAVALLIYSAPVIQIEGETLRVGRARIEISYIKEVTQISADESFKERGTGLNALAYTRFQPSVKTLLRVDIKDANDPTPYWLFSTRRGAELAKLLG